MRGLVARTVLLVFMLLPMTVGLALSQSHGSVKTPLPQQVLASPQFTVKGERKPDAQEIVQRMRRRVERRMDRLDLQDVRKAPRTYEVSFRRDRDRSGVVDPKAQ